MREGVPHVREFVEGQTGWWIGGRVVPLFLLLFILSFHLVDFLPSVIRDKRWWIFVFVSIMNLSFAGKVVGIIIRY